MLIIRVPWQAPVIPLLVGKFSERLESGTTILHSVLSNVTRTLAPREFKRVHWSPGEILGSGGTNKVITNTWERSGALPYLRGSS